MSSLRTWVQLPGPADFLATILDDLADRVAVFAGLPEEIPGSALGVEVAELVKQRRLGEWQAVRSCETVTTAPLDSMVRRFEDAQASGAVLWVNATGGCDAAHAWADYARQLAEFPDDMPRLCIAMGDACAETCSEDKRLRQRLWRDFVTALDARVLSERFSRRAGHGRAHTQLKSTLVAELAGTSLTDAEHLLRDPLGRILRIPRQNGDQMRERIWAAQVAVLFPLVERERQRLLQTYRTLWRLPHVRKDGKRIRCLNDLEVGDMAEQVRNGVPLDDERRQCLVWLCRVRNTLAHNKVVPWDTLVSPVAVQIEDFRR